MSSIGAMTVLPIAVCSSVFSGSAASALFAVLNAVEISALHYTYIAHYKFSIELTWLQLEYDWANK